MSLKAVDLYHTGLVVDDVDKARAFLTETAGYQWGQTVGGDTPVVTPPMARSRCQCASSTPSTSHGWSWCRPFPAPSGRPPTRASTTLATGPTTSTLPYRGLVSRGLSIEVKAPVAQWLVDVGLLQGTTGDRASSS